MNIYEEKYHQYLFMYFFLNLPLNFISNNWHARCED